ncbi:MAG: hypothetical protein M3Y50_01730 [Acidobacteriota bacterium]|nr:hypothetical protein [Acidobacteriota bacterium]
MIVLEDEGYDVSFGPTSKAPYLSQTLVSKLLLSRGYGTGTPGYTAGECEADPLRG